MRWREEVHCGNWEGVGKTMQSWQWISTLIKSLQTRPLDVLLPSFPASRNMPIFSVAVHTPDRPLCTWPECLPATAHLCAFSSTELSDNGLSRTIFLHVLPARSPQLTIWLWPTFSPTAADILSSSASKRELNLGSQRDAEYRNCPQSMVTRPNRKERDSSPKARLLNFGVSVQYPLMSVKFLDCKQQQIIEI